MRPLLTSLAIAPRVDFARLLSWVVIFIAVLSGLLAMTVFYSMLRRRRVRERPSLRRRRFPHDPWAAAGDRTSPPSPRQLEEQFGPAEPPADESDGPR